MGEPPQLGGGGLADRSVGLDRGFEHASQAAQLMSRRQCGTNRNQRWSIVRVPRKVALHFVPQCQDDRMIAQLVGLKHRTLAHPSEHVLHVGKCQDRRRIRAVLKTGHFGCQPLPAVCFGKVRG